MLRSTRGRAMRRSWAIHGYVGANGGGKSAAMIWDTIPSLRSGRPVLSTVRLLDFDNPRPCEGWRTERDGTRVVCEVCHLDHERLINWSPPEPVVDPETGEFVPGEVEPLAYVHGHAHPLWTPFTEWAQLIEWRAGDVLMDEVTGVASSRESHSMPAPVANQLMQLRRSDVVVRWSAPNWKRADILIREVSQAVTHCRGYLPKVAAGQDRMWRQRRLFRWKTYDADLFEDFTVGKREQLGSLVRDWHWGPRSPSFSAYDTYDQVLSIGTVSDAGRCYHCGGKRAAPECSCHDYQARRAAARPVRSAPASAKREDGAAGGSDVRDVPGGGARRSASARRHAASLETHPATGHHVVDIR